LLDHLWRVGRLDCQHDRRHESQAGCLTDIVWVFSVPSSRLADEHPTGEANVIASTCEPVGAVLGAVILL
jgi:hypothetical protein